ncbi:hypothetical protein ABIB06_007367 [Bradyrhizobium sp. LB8.2]|uniref:hypothetical protein n=1 Tax=unclassified Bradyrhizobium TaxID=2631580 RepID=UPI003396A15F
MARTKTPARSNHKDVVPMRFDEERKERYQAEADRRGIALSRVLDEFILIGEKQDQFRAIMESARGPNKLHESKYDQHVFFGALWLNALNESLATKLKITDEMLTDWASLPNPVLDTKTVAIPSIKAGTKTALQNFTKEIERPTVFLSFITFVLVHRPLTHFDMNPGPVIPGHYQSDIKNAMWRMYATNAISYALLCKVYEKHTDKHPLDLTKRLAPSDAVLQAEFERFDRFRSNSMSKTR